MTGPYVMQNTNLTTGQRLVGVPTIAAGGTDELVLFGPYATNPISPMLQVGAAPVVLKAYGLLTGETVTVQNVYAPTGVMSPYSYKGEAIVLTSTLSTAVLAITGNYRLVFAGAMLGVVLVTATTLSGRPGGVDTAALQSQLANPNLFFGPSVTSTLSQKVQVTRAPWAFRAYGLTPGVTIQVLNVTPTATGEVTSPFAQNMQEYLLSSTNNTLVLELAGSYRFQLAGDPTGVLLVGNENPIIFIDPYIPSSYTFGDTANIVHALAGDVVSFDLTLVTDAGGGVLQRTAFDGYGRKTGTSSATTTDLAEGTNLYFTDQRAEDAIGGILMNSANVSMTYVAGTSITAMLNDLADSGVGSALVKITRDAKGRVSGTHAATTDDLAEGSNLYFTMARVLATILAGLSTATNAVITAADSVLVALGKLQAQITATNAVVNPISAYILTTHSGALIQAHTGETLNVRV